MWEFETVSQKKRKTNQEKKKTRLIVMLNLQVNDTITMPTPAIAMVTVFYCIDRLKKPPPPLKQVKCAVCTQPLPCVEPFLQLSLLSSYQLTRPRLKQHLTFKIGSEERTVNHVLLFHLPLPPPLCPSLFCFRTTSHLLGCRSSSVATAFCSSQLFFDAVCAAVAKSSKSFGFSLCVHIVKYFIGHLSVSLG